VRQTKSQIKAAQEHKEWLAKNFVRPITAVQADRNSVDFFAKQATLRESRNRTPNIPSRETPGGQTPAKAPAVYTGDAMIGIATMHKSNLVPIFSAEEAINVATMRRN